MPDDYSADLQTTGAVAVGGSATGTIETAYDQDWFAVELVAGRTYRFDLQGSPGGGGTLPDTYFRAIYNSEGRYQSGSYNDNFAGSRDSQVTFTPTQSGTYYARVSGDRNETGTYTLAVTDMTPPETGNPPPADPPADTAAAVPESETAQSQPEPASVPEGATDLPNDNSTPGRVAVGGSVTGTIGTAYDQDRFAVELVAGRTYQFDLQGSPGGGGTLPDTYFRAIYNSEGRYQSGSYNDNFAGSRDSQVTFTPTQSGTYYARVSGDRNETGTYTLAVTDMTPQHAPAFARPQYEFALAENADGSSEGVSLGTVAAVDPEGAALSYRLVDGNGSGRFTLDAESGELFYTGTGEDYESAATRYELTLRASDGTLFADTTVTVNVTDVPEQAVVPPDPDPVIDPEGPAIAAHAQQQSSTSEPAGTDFSADASTEGRIAVDDSVTGAVGTAGDVDWFAVELVAGRVYRFVAEPLHHVDERLSTPEVHLMSPDGEALESGGLALSFSGPNGSGFYMFSEFEFVATETGTHHVAVSALGGLSRTGAYDLSVSEIPDDYDDRPATGGSVDVGGSEGGEVDFAGDRDWFAVELEAGRSYRLDLEGSVTDAGTLYDPYLYGIFDSNGTRLADTTNGNSGAGLNSRFTFTPTEGGTYYVAAGGWDDLTGTYQLSVIDVTDGVPDDYPDDVHTSGSVAVGGSTRGLVEYRGDVDWFAVTLEGGTNYQIDVRGSWTDYGDAVFDPYLYGVYDADGNLLPDTEDDIGGEGLNSRLWFRPDTSGTYYVAAGCDHGRDSSSVRDEGSYTVAVTDLTPGAGLVAAAALGEPVTGRIEFDYERDWIGVSLEAGTTYRFDLEGYVPSYYDRQGQHHGGTLRDPWILGIYDETRNEIPGTSNNNGGHHYNSRVTFTPSEDGDYYILAGAYGRYQGTYTLLFDEVDTM